MFDFIHLDYYNISELENYKSLQIGKKYQLCLID